MLPKPPAKPPRLTTNPATGQLAPAGGATGMDWLQDLAEATGLPSEMAGTMLNQVSAAIGLQDSGDPSVANAFIAAVEAVAPKDPLEAMLVVQAVCSHHWSMKTLGHAQKAGLPEIRDRHLKLAFRLMTIFRDHLTALDRHRRGGEQRVRVEHVHVHAGGQAIVGNINKGGNTHGK